jgi:hypothetical protein
MAKNTDFYVKIVKSIQFVSCPSTSKAERRRFFHKIVKVMTSLRETKLCGPKHAISN